MEKAKRRPSRLKRVILILLACFGVVAMLIFVNQLPTLYAQFRDYHTPVWEDNSLLTQQPCALPCWHGLQVGISTLADVEAFVHDNPNIPDWSLNTTTDWSRPNINEFGAFWFDKNNVLKGLSRTFAHKMFVRDVIKVYGEPVATRLVRRDEPYGRYGWWGVVLIYSHYGLAVGSHFEPEGKDGEMNFRVPDNLTVYYITLFQPTDDLRDVLPPSFSGLTGREFNEGLEKEHTALGWIGFGTMIEP